MEAKKIRIIREEEKRREREEKRREGEERNIFDLICVIVLYYQLEVKPVVPEI